MSPIGLLAAAAFAVGVGWWVSATWANARAPEGSKKAATSSAAKGAPVKITKTEEEWRKSLTPEQYRVLREEGTEKPFANRYWNHHGRGTYVCAGCGQELFSSKTKFDSGSGWPSYTSPVAGAHVREVTDRSLGMTRVEVECSGCGGHLGHVFDDGPAPTGLRYCINSAALNFVGESEPEAKK